MRRTTPAARLTLTRRTWLPNQPQWSKMSAVTRDPVVVPATNRANPDFGDDSGRAEHEDQAQQPHQGVNGGEVAHGAEERAAGHDDDRRRQPGLTQGPGEVHLAEAGLQQQDADGDAAGGEHK